MYTSPIQQKILLLLLERKMPISLSQLSREFQMGTRELQSHLKSLDEVCAYYDLVLQKKLGSGVMIQGTETSKEQLKKDLFSIESSTYDEDDRVIFLLCAFLESDQPLTIEYLANQFRVAPETISQDLDHLNQWLWNARLKLTSNRENGIEITGEEIDKKLALGSVIAEQMEITELIDLIKEELGNSLSKQLFDQISGERLMIVEHALKDLNQDLSVPFPESAYLALTVHLCLAIERVQSGETITLNATHLEELSLIPEYKIAEKIIHRIEMNLPISFPIDEIGYVTLHLRNGQQQHHPEYDVDLDDLRKRVNQLVDACENRLEFRLSEDDSLIPGLITHLASRLPQIRMKQKISNTLLSKIKEDYWSIFQIVKEEVFWIFHELLIPDEEIGHIVIHLGAAFERLNQQDSFDVIIICPSGVGTSQLLATQIQSQIPQIHVVQTLSAYLVEELSVKNYDFIISTVKIPSLQDDEYIQINPILTDQEAERIREYMGQIPPTIVKIEQPSMLGLYESIHSLLGIVVELMKQFYLSSVPNMGWSNEEVIRQIGHDLISEGFLRDGQSWFEQTLLQLENGLSVYQFKGDEIEQPFFAVYELQESIHKGVDQLIILLTPKDAKKEVQELMLTLESLCQQSGAIEKLATNDPEIIRTYFLQQLHDVCYGKLKRDHE
ncbi:transcriptional antiterminator, BglG family [Seinonella peptonophila]|uniref:Transcriptional antiterminator, BglG family n=1 Tax=Seinonella peptonophila TaxID=112248 RepID=A0A1M5BDK7_9BACL|nr:transcription antiterminator [Seinonella peptonophila]SHF40427.1 transcriptional antiterminator, BglG family [Seinonella peptonophila]